MVHVHVRAEHQTVCGGAVLAVEMCVLAGVTGTVMERMTVDDMDNNCALETAGI